MEETEYVCTLTGRTAREKDLILDAPEDDDLDALPIGWLKVTVERRGVSARWVEVQNRKIRLRAQVVGQLSEVPEEARAEAIADAEMAIDAQFFAIEQGTPKYVTVSESVYVRDPDSDKQAGEAWVQVAAVLQVDVGRPE